MKAGSRGKAVVEKAAKMRPKNNPILRTRIYFFFSLVLLFVLMVFSSSCSINSISELNGQNTADKTSQPTTKNTQQTPSISYEESSSTPDLVLSATPTILPTSSYRYVDPTIDQYFPTARSTEQVLSISSSQVENDGFLYKKMILTIHFQNDNEREVWANINLDDFEDNSVEKSDIVIQRDLASGGAFYFLFPVNETVYYFSDEQTMDFVSCLEHFPISGLTSIEYLLQEDHLLTGNPFCVITNENRLAILNYEKNSIINNLDHTEDVSLSVMVYQNRIK